MLHLDAASHLCSIKSGAKSPMGAVPCSDCSRCQTACITIHQDRWPVDIATSHSDVPEQAYYTSIILQQHEYWFSDAGVCWSLAPQRFQPPQSHRNKPGTKVFQVGLTSRTGEMLQKCLSPFFEPNSYDHVLKNCNSFTDCALAFLLSKRLPLKYSSAQENLSLLSCTGWHVRKVNEAALKFNLEAVVMKVDEHAWNSGGN
eukprot:s109_g20.t2